jgi:hypothetical protein
MSDIDTTLVNKLQNDNFDVIQNEDGGYTLLPKQEVPPLKVEGVIEETEQNTNSATQSEDVPPFPPSLEDKPLFQPIVMSANGVELVKITDIDQTGATVYLNGNVLDRLYYFLSRSLPDGGKDVGAYNQIFDMVGMIFKTFVDNQPLVEQQNTEEVIPSETIEEIQE